MGLIEGHHLSLFQDKKNVDVVLKKEESKDKTEEEFEGFSPSQW